MLSPGVCVLMLEPGEVPLGCGGSAPPLWGPHGVPAPSQSLSFPQELLQSRAHWAGGDPAHTRGGGLSVLGGPRGKGVSSWDPQRRPRWGPVHTAAPASVASWALPLTSPRGPTWSWAPAPQLPGCVLPVLLMQLPLCSCGEMWGAGTEPSALLEPMALAS